MAFLLRHPSSKRLVSIGADGRASFHGERRLASEFATREQAEAAWEGAKAAWRAANPRARREKWPAWARMDALAVESPDPDAEHRFRIHFALEDGSRWMRFSRGRCWSSVELSQATGFCSREEAWRAVEEMAPGRSVEIVAFEARPVGVERVGGAPGQGPSAFGLRLAASCEAGQLREALGSGRPEDARGGAAARSAPRRL